MALMNGGEVLIRALLEEAANSDVITVIDTIIDAEANLDVPVLFDMIVGLWLQGCPEPYCEGNF